MPRSSDNITAINRLIWLDCLLRLTNIPDILYASGIFDWAALGGSSPTFCTIKVTITFVCHLLPRLLSTTIAVFRWLSICHPTTIMTARQRTLFFLCVSGALATLATSLAGGVVYHKERYSGYLSCLGAPAQMVKWDLPASDPFVLACIASFFSNLVITPILYTVIFSYRRRLLGLSVGLSKQSLRKRKSSNILTTKFNFLIWLSELMMFMPVLPKMLGQEVEKGLVTAYLILTSCSTPVLYFISIEANRMAILDWFYSCTNIRRERPEDAEAKLARLAFFRASCVERKGQGGTEAGLEGAMRSLRGVAVGVATQEEVGEVDGQDGRARLGGRQMTGDFEDMGSDMEGVTGGAEVRVSGVESMEGGGGGMKRGAGGVARDGEGVASHFVKVASYQRIERS